MLGQLRHIISAGIIILFSLVIVFVFMKIPDWKESNTNSTTVKTESYKKPITSTEEEGKRIYTSKCIACHGSFDIVHGAITLHNIEDRWADKQELFSFIRRSEDVPPSHIKDVEYLTSVKNYHKFEDLTDQQIQMIPDYFYWEDIKYDQPKH